MPYNISLNNLDIVLSAAPDNFTAIARDVFRYQYENNKLYHDYCDLLHTNLTNVISILQIPFLPVSFFKTHKVITGNIHSAELIFESSGTTGEQASKHYVTETSIYRSSLLQGFEQFYGDPSEYVILALLPSYLERQNASLVYMAKTLMEQSGHPESGFYINEWGKLSEVLSRLEKEKQKVLLLGVTFALLDFADAFPMQLSSTIVMETGGMKGRREELTRAEVHTILKKQWQLHEVHSEYGMTELLSQAYAASGGIFKCTNSMRVFVRDINDPLDVSEQGTGCLNIVDLANVNSCSFIATEDIGTIFPNGSFEVLGRMDHSALRGCSLMAV